ncbi:MAG: hypothetical protein CMI18_13445 [Opitutaceae bacterium]|nr:hypothetical protein [Opitutaceae bacterium]|tara:strand:- start:1006 stop:1215 length:210 start_codon:yes stop_codon:yes gene_type:complete
MIEEEISSLLRDLLSATADSDSEGVLKATLALDSVQKERASEIPKQLQHYLERRSYPKALAFLEGCQDS